MLKKSLYAVFALCISSVAFAQLQSGDKVAIIGDSITEQKLYSVFIEDYLLMCKPAQNLTAIQFGWGGETSWGFLARMQNDALYFHPTVATTCYGMNDGGYDALTEEKANHYRQATRDIVRGMKAAGVRFIVVGSPGVVDSTTFKKNFFIKADAAGYNKTLSQLRDIAEQVAKEEGVAFADVHGVMMDAMQKAKEKYGADYPFAGKDGVHPGPNGHLAMAYAFLKALGVSGEIGTITFDLAGNQATATDGHQVISAAGGTVEIESTRYPFCFYGDPKSSDATAGIAEIIPFNQDLNRFILKVTNASGDKFKVTWGEESKEFSSADLAKGINLAAEFSNNPFSDAFKKVEDAIRAQQNFETPMVKNLIHYFPQQRDVVPDESAQFEQIENAAKKRDDQLMESAVASMKPVRHTIKIEAVK
jgi:lysophospholipase L1-like esterase